MLRLNINTDVSQEKKSEYECVQDMDCVVSTDVRTFGTPPAHR